MPYLIRRLIVQRIDAWRQRLDRLGAYLALPPNRAGKARRRGKA